MPTATIDSTRTRIPLVDLRAQYVSIKPEVDAAIAAVLDRCAFIGGETLAGFENRFAEFAGSDHAIGTSSGTTAIHLALAALGVGPGDEVILPAHTFIATAEPVAQIGARIVLADIEPDTCTIDPASVARCITPRTRAIIPVHIYGQMADMQALRDIADRANHDIAIIEDAAQAHGATRDDQPVGHAGRIACYSFFPGKNLGAYGDAGMVTTNDADLAKRCCKLVNHGREDKYRHDLVGFNYRMDALQAAVLDVKLAHLDAWTERRRSRAALYDALLRDVPGVYIPTVANGNRHVYHLYVIQVDDREGLRHHLDECGISAGVHYPIPLNQQPAIVRHGYDADALPITDRVALRILSLPIYPELTDDQVRHIVERIHQFQMSRG